MAVREGDAWTWKSLDDRDAQKAIEDLFGALQHGVKSGPFLLPNPYTAEPS
jgi:hypothetical protein